MPLVKEGKENDNSIVRLFMILFKRKTPLKIQFLELTRGEYLMVPNLVGSKSQQFTMAKDGQLVVVLAVVE